MEERPPRVTRHRASSPAARALAAVDLPVESFDERFTTKLAEAGENQAEQDAVAAAHLLSSYLTWKSARPA